MSSKSANKVKAEAVTKESFIRFLLGDLPPEVRDEIEISLFGEELFDLFLGVEIQLIEQYLSNQLSERDAQLFELNYLSTRRGYEQVEAVKAIASYLDSLPDSATLEATPAQGERLSSETSLIQRAVSQAKPIAFPVHRWLVGSLATATALLLVVTIYLVKARFQQAENIKELQAQVETLRVEHEQALNRLNEDRNALNEQLRKEKDERDKLAAKLLEEQRNLQKELRLAQNRRVQNPNERISEYVASNFDLFYATNPRGSGESPAFSLNSRTKTVNFRLHFPFDTNLIEISHATIQSVGGGNVWEISPPVRPRHFGQHLVVRIEHVPADRFSVGNYILTLVGKDNQGHQTSVSYPFAIKP